MTDSIRCIFEHNMELIGDMDKAVIYFREQQYEKALGMVADSIDQVKSVIEAIIADREYFNLVATESMLEMLSGILEAKKNSDFILLADLISLQLVNFLIGVQELIISKEEIIFDEESYKENIRFLLQYSVGIEEKLMETIDTQVLLENGYRIEFTSCGRMTLAAENKDSKYYFHTNSKVQEEAFLLARSWFKEDKKCYIVYGLGMGYHLRELQDIAGDAVIEVYEADRNVIQLACAFTDMKGLLMNNKTRLIYDPEFVLIKERVTVLLPEEALCVHYPSYKNIRNSKGIEILNRSVPWLKAAEVY